MNGKPTQQKLRTSTLASLTLVLAEGWKISPVRIYNDKQALNEFVEKEKDEKGEETWKID